MTVTVEFDFTCIYYVKSLSDLNGGPVTLDTHSPSSHIEAVVPTGSRVHAPAEGATAGPQHGRGARIVTARGQDPLRGSQRARTQRQRLEQGSSCLERAG